METALMSDMFNKLKFVLLDQEYMLLQEKI